MFSVLNHHRAVVCVRESIYGIHIDHWKILWSSYRKLAWVQFEPTTTAFCSDAVTDWSIKPWVQLTLRTNFVQQLQFHLLFSVRFHFGYCLRQSPRLIKTFYLSIHLSIYLSIDLCIHIYSIYIYNIYLYLYLSIDLCIHICSIYI